MKTKLAILAKCTVAAAFLLLLSVPAIAQTATVTTDKEFYGQGENVIISGTGWLPGETVALLLHEDPQICGDKNYSSVADANGNFTNTQFTTHTRHAGVTFVLTATGQTSGRTAQTTFIDAPDPRFDIAPAHVPSAGANVFSTLVRNIASSSSDTARCIRITPMAGTTITGATFSAASPGTTGPWTLTSGAGFVQLRSSGAGVFGVADSSNNWVRFEITTSATVSGTWTARMNTP